MSSEGTLVWAAQGPSANQAVVEAAARDLDLGVRFSTHAELLERLRNERCNVVCIEFGYDAHPGLALLKQVVERMPRLTIVVASNDASVAMIRAVLEAGAADFPAAQRPGAEQGLHKLSQTANGPSARRAPRVASSLSARRGRARRNHRP
jgi:DNA-binding NarL/FixJ family response regulator